MPVTEIVPGGTAPANRLRVAAQDTTSDDATLEAVLRSTLSECTMRLYLPTGEGGATGATITIAHVVADDVAVPAVADHVQLTLARTITGEAVSTIELAPSSRYRMIRNLVNWIGAIDRGWQVGFAMGRDVQWVDPSSTSWLDALVAVGRLPRFGPSCNLELVSALAAYGDEDTAAEIHLYQIGVAAKRLIAQGASGTTASATVSSIRRGNVSVTYTDPREREIERLAGLGWMAA